MRVCIIRNAESKTNASMIRVIDALLSSGKECILLTRSRYNNLKGVVKKDHLHGNKRIDNYEINIKAEPGRGLINIFQLIIYQVIVFKWILTNKNEYDVIHSYDLDSGLAVFLASKITRKKYIYHIADFYVDSRGNVPNIFKSVLRKLEYMIIANAETTIICTEERKQQIKGSKPKNLVVVHNVPSIKINAEKNKDLKTEKSITRPITFTYVGGLSESRFIKKIIDIFKDHADFQLDIAGMGPLSNYVEHSANNHKNINYYGMISYEEALELYSKGDVMFAIYDPTVANHRYSAPNKVYEAMMLGKPIIVAKGTSVDTLVGKEKIGISIDYTKEDFEKILKYIKNNPNGLIEMGNRSKEISELYSWDKMKEKIIEVYKQVEKYI